MQCVNKYLNNITEAKSIMEKYEVNISELDDMYKEIKYFRVTSPVIGNFSTGKSSLINALVEKRILSVDITPETAVPTEIYYGKNKVIRVDNEGKNHFLKIEDLPVKDLTIEDTKLIKIEYDNPFLKDILNVKIVDLPGFDSGIELHNKAIDQYVENSLAYILAIAVDEPVLKDNIESFLAELELHQMPLYVILTKSARISEEEIEDCKKLVEGIIKKIITKSEIKIGVCESYRDVKVEDFKTFLYEIQDNAIKIFENKYGDMFVTILNEYRNFLNDQLNKQDLSFSELEVEKQELNTGVYELLKKLAKEKAEFQEQLENCVASIRQKIFDNLESALPEISSMIQNEKSVNDRINVIVRNAVAISIKTEFEPRIQKYLKKISSMISIDVLNDENIKFNIEKSLTDEKIYDTTRKVMPFALAGVGAVFGPIGISIGALAGSFIDRTINVSQSKVKEKRADEIARQIIDVVATQTVDAVDGEIRSYFDTINEDLEKDIYKQKELLDKSIEDIEMRINIEEKEKKKQINQIKEDMSKIEDLIKSLRN